MVLLRGWGFGGGGGVNLICRPWIFIWKSSSLLKFIDIISLLRIFSETEDSSLNWRLVLLRDEESDEDEVALKKMKNKIIFLFLLFF